MKTSDTGVALIKRFEGLELEAYKDIAGIWTIGYGHTGPDVQPGMRISEHEAEELLKSDLRPREEAVTRLTSVSLNQNEFDSLVSFVYNVGIDSYRKSTARKRLNANNRVGAAEALTWWNKATVGGVLREVRGLTRRRASERALFLEPSGPARVTDNSQLAENSRITPMEDAPRRPNLAESRSIQGATVAGGAGVAAGSIGKEEKTASELNQQQLDQMKPAPGDATTTTAPTGDTKTAASSGDAKTASGGDTAILAPGEVSPTDEVASDLNKKQLDQMASSKAKTATMKGSDSTTTAAPVVAPAPSLSNTRQMVSVDTERPLFERQQTADAQIQFALMILIALSVAYVVFARLDDWWRYKR